MLFLSGKHYAQFGPDVDQSVKLTAEVDAENSTITLNWIVDERATGFDLYRKVYGEADWGNKIGEYDINTNRYLDTDISPNVQYEYKIQKYTEEGVDGFGYLLSGINVQPKHFSGTVLLLITQSTYNNLSSQITNFLDVIGAEGWSHRLLIVDNGLTDEEVKNELIATYSEAPFSNCLILGDVPIPLSGDVAPDGHVEKGGAWASDLFYGDIDGTWTDSLVNNTVSSWPVNNNIPGDGKWDQSTIPSDIEVAVGRVDFSNLPVFEENEYELLANYLEKNIAYRTGQKNIRKKAVIHNINPWVGGLGQNGIRNFSTMVGPENIIYDDFDAAWEDSFMWLYAASSGFHDLLFTVTTSEELSNRPLKAVFTNFFGSRFGNYDYTNNFMRSALGSGDVLSTCWVGAPHWYFHSMAMGYSLGHSTITTQNNDVEYFPGNNVKSIHVNLLGDPTLKLYPMQKLSSLTVIEYPTFNELSWQPTIDSEGFFVYRKREGENEYEVLNTEPILDTTYKDDCPETNQTYTYLVRATRLELTPSGSYYNLSVGSTASITTTLNHNPVASFDLEFQDGFVYLIDQSEMADSIFISGVENVVAQNDGSYLLENVENGDLITLAAYNACGVDSVSMVVVISSVHDPKNEVEITVFPNPARTTLKVSSLTAPILRWKLIKYDGAIIAENIVNPEQEVNIDVSQFESGIYYLTISITRKEIVKRIFIE